MRRRTLFWNYILFVSLFLEGCAATSRNSGIIWANDWDKLNTIDGYYIQNADQWGSRRDSIAFVFTESEETKIERVADSIRFWEISQDSIAMPAGHTQMGGSSTIRVKTNSRDKILQYNILNSESRRRIDPMIDTINAILRSRPEVIAMPPKGLVD